MYKIMYKEHETIRQSQRRTSIAVSSVTISRAYACKRTPVVSTVDSIDERLSDATGSALLRLIVVCGVVLLLWFVAAFLVLFGSLNDACHLSKLPSCLCQGRSPFWRRFLSP